jgi:hypothetical protein
MRAICALVIPSLLWAQAKKGPPSVGYEDTPFIRGQKWRVHDIKRPHPRVIQPGPPPSDAVVLFDGKDLSKWMMQNREGQISPPGWKVENGHMEVVRGTGHLVTKEKFGDCQLHIEWATPAEVHSSSQERGNSGVLLMSRYEIQVLDSFQNLTYADGQAAAIYGQFPPLVNASRGPGQWQTYDIVFEAPHFEAEKLVKPAYATVFHNGVVVHHRQEMLGPMKHRVATSYEPHAAAEPLMLQNHGDPVRYRNIWIRPLGSYDRSE